MDFTAWSRHDLKYWKLVLYGAIILVISPLAINFVYEPSKYALFIFVTTLTILLTALLLFPSKHIQIHINSLSDRIDLFLIGISLTILVLNIFNLHFNVANLILSEVVVYFLTGWFGIRLFGLDRKINSSMAIFILSCILSLGISSLIFMAAVATNVAPNAIVISGIYLTYAICIKIIKNRKNAENRLLLTESGTKKFRTYDILLLIWVFAFFSFVISTFYPGLPNIPGSDIVRHVSSANELLQSPNLYTSEYPWFHFPTALLKSMSGVQDWAIQIGTGFLSIILVLSFYVMAKKYLGDIDPRAPILATVFFFIFAGFGWLYFLTQLGQNSTVLDYFGILQSTNSSTYWDVGLGGSTWLWFWFRPLTVGFSAFFCLFYILRASELSKPMFIGLVSFLTVILSQSHISELVMLVGIIFTTCIFVRRSELRLKEGIIALLIGLICSILISNTNPVLLNSHYLIPQNYTILQLIGVIMVSALVLKLPRLKLRLPSLNIILITTIGVFVYLVLVLSWLNTVDKSALTKIATALAVPWEFYPVLLGVVGLLAVPSTLVVIRRYSKHPVIIFVILFFFSIFFGRLVTYFNLELGGLGYWERRTVPFVFVAASVLCPFFVLFVLRHPFLKSSSANKMINTIIISCIVLFGTFSTVLSLQVQNHNIDTISISEPERQLQHSLRNMGSNYTILTANSRASDIVEYLNPGYLIGYYKYQVWPAESPELPLKVMSVLNDKFGIYLNSGDKERIDRYGFGNGYVASHLLEIGKSVDKRHEGLVVFPKMSPPVDRSDLALVLPNSKSNVVYYAYDFLSTGLFNYTTINLSDVASLNKTKVLIAPTEKVGFELQKLKDEFNLGFHDLIVMNLDGYGNLSKLERTTSDMVIDGKKEQWFSEGINKGSIGIPKVKLNQTGIENQLFSIKVDNGTYSLWQLYRNFIPAINVKTYDLFSINWYGKNDGKYYVVEFNTKSGGSFWYRFQDTWSGWKKISIPLHHKNSRVSVFGINLDIFAAKNAFWDNVSRLNIRTESSNTNNSGNFYIKNLAFESTIKSSGISMAGSSHPFNFPSRIEVFPIQTYLPVDRKILYMNTTVPYLFVENNSNLNIWYYNVYPITNMMQKNTSFASVIYPDLGKLVFIKGSYDYNAPDSDIRSLVKGGIISFRSMNATGQFSARSESSTVIPYSQKVDIIQDGKKSVFKNVEMVLPIAEEYSTVKSKGFSTLKGNGYYFSGVFKNGFINYFGHPARILLKLPTDTVNLEANNITLAVPNGDISLRQPSVNAIGTISLNNLYAYGDLNNEIRSLGTNAKISGTANFKVQTSDVYTVAAGTKLSGHLVRDPPLYSYNDVYNLSQLFNFNNFRHIVAISVILFIIVYIFNARKSRLHESPTSKT